MEDFPRIIDVDNNGWETANFVWKSEGRSTQQKEQQIWAVEKRPKKRVFSETNVSQLADKFAIT